MLITAGSFKLGFPGAIKSPKHKMGNAPSSASGSQAASTPPSGLPAGSQGSNPPGSASASTTPVGVPRSASQPIRAGGLGGLASTSAPSTATTAFHSGLTPPAAPPSPAPPGTPLLMPFAGHLSPQNPHALVLPQAKDYSKSVVTKLILDERLAPFYRGLEDIEDGWTEDRVGELLSELREKDYEEDVPNSTTMRLKDDRDGASHAGVGGTVAKKIGIHKSREAKMAEDKEERARREKRAYVNAVECPICFLNYPPNINTSRCCQQPICTECFVQIKRGEPSITHLESEPACCPFCVETDFGVIYERPPAPTQDASNQFALSVSPEHGMSGFSQALSIGSEDAELSVGPGMAPKAQETMRRKSVNAKAEEVVTIDEIRPDWEMKLNSVKAAAARRAARRIVMRQVGDRLVPIGYTSSRAPATADFSMSVGRATEENGSRRSRGSSRQRDLEELMIMEAMRLSLIDHEEHQKNMHEGTQNKGRSSGTATPNSQTGESSAMGRNRADTVSSVKSQSGASKLFQKLGGRSRSGSAAKQLAQAGDDRSSERRVSFAMAGGSGTATGSNSPRRSIDRPSLTSAATGSGSSGSGVTSSSANASSPVGSYTAATSTSPISTTSIAPSPLNTSITPSTLLGRSPPSSLTPAGGQPIAPVTTLANHTAVQTQTESSAPSSAPPSARTTEGLPRLSLDMPALTPEAPRQSREMNRHSADLSRKSLDRPSQTMRENIQDDGYRPLLDQE